MNKFFKSALVIFIVVIIILIGFYVKSFVVGNSSFDNIVVDKVTVSETSIVIEGNYTDSGVAFKDFSYTQVGTEIYVTINNVKVSSKYKSGSFKINIPTKGDEIKDIHLTDSKKTKVIFSK